MSAADDEATWAALRRLFELVCDLPPEARRARLEAEIGRSPLIEDVLALCAAETVGRRIAAPVAGMLAELVETELEPGARVGPWRIERTLASGGMGRVYLAERDDGQYRQRVAIKLLRGRFDVEAEARFLVERQILADLQHPNIARLIDGGRGADGQPYLAMEFVEGERIDVWARGRPLAERLRLFAEVCRAVQFAHGHLVLHCDLKPSNVLVRRDGSPALVDFGIARLLDRDAARAPGAADFLTPRYASPEQKLGQALTTASDVYGLGRILAELASESPTAASGESADAETAETPGAALRGDLAWIVRRATAENPGERYRTPVEIAEDLERSRRRLPVRARPATPGYVAVRFLQRHWPAVLTAVAFALTLGVAVWRVVDERDRALAAESRARLEAATSAEVVRFLTAIFAHADPEAGARPEITARELLDAGRQEIDGQFLDQPALRRRLLGTLAWIYQRIGEPAPALALFEAAAALPAPEDPAEAVELLDALAHAHWALERNDRAEDEARRAVALAQARLPPDHPLRGQAWNTLGMVLDDTGHYEEAARALSTALAIRERTLGPDHDATAATLHNLGLLARHRGDLASARELFGRAQAIKERLFGTEHPRILNGLQQLATIEAELGRLAEAETMLRRLLTLRQRLHGEETRPTAGAWNELGSVLHDQGRFAEAIAHYARAIAIESALLGPDSVALAAPINNLATAHEDRGDLAAAEPLFRRSLALRIAERGEDNIATARAQHNLARLLARRGDCAGAAPLIARALATRLAVHGPAHTEPIATRVLAADCALQRGDAAEAAARLAEADAAAAEVPTLGIGVAIQLQRVKARLALAQGRAADAVTALAEARRRADAVYPAAHPLRAELQLEAIAARRAAGEAVDDAEIDAPLAQLERALHPEAPALRRAAALRAGR